MTKSPSFNAWEIWNPKLLDEAEETKIETIERTMRIFNLTVGLTVCLSDTAGAVSLGGVYRSFEEIRYSYSPESSGRSRILHAFIHSQKGNFVYTRQPSG